MSLQLTGKSVLVTGGAGFIGSTLVDRVLRESPGHVVVVDDLFLGRKENLAQAYRSFPKLKFYKQDASDYEAMKQIIANERVEVLFHLAVIPLPTSLERPRWTITTNVAMTTVVCELLREGYFKTLIHFSSSEAYGSAQYVPMDESHPLRPPTPYAASKAASDHVVLSYRETFGIDTVIIRPFNNFGPRQNEGAFAGIIPIVIRRALLGQPIVIYGDGKQTRDFVFVEDVCNGAVSAYGEPRSRGEVINLASGKEVTINDLVHKILSLVKSDVEVVHQSPRPGDVLRHLADTSKARKLIGFQSVVSLEDGLRKTIDWYRGQGTR